MKKQTVNFEFPNEKLQDFVKVVEDWYNELD